MVIDHICFAVANLETGIEYWERTFGYRQMTEIIFNSRQKVKVVFLHKNESLLIKLIEPAKDNTSLLNFVKNGGGFHHLCFKCDDLEDGMTEMREKGLITLVQPQPGEAFDNQKIGFLLAKYGLFIELIDTDRKAGLIN